MFADEGIGVHFCKYLEKNYKFSSKLHSIDFIDGGTLANFLTHIIVDYDHVLLVDCISSDDGEIGDVYFFDYDNIPLKINWSGSAHEVEMQQTLAMMDLLGDRPKTHVLAVIPQRIEPLSFDISYKLQKSINIMEKQALLHLKSIGFTYEKINNFNIQEIANEFKKARHDT